MKKQTGYMDTIMELLPELTLKELEYLKFSTDVMIDKTKQEQPLMKGIIPSEMTKYHDEVEG